MLMASECSSKCHKNKCNGHSNNGECSVCKTCPNGVVVKNNNNYAPPSTPLGFATRAIRVGIQPGRWGMHQIVPPISLSTTYRQSKPGEFVGHEYIREGTPTRDLLEESVAVLEQARHCRVFASGLAAIGAIANFLRHGDHIICADDGYGGTHGYFKEIGEEQRGMELSFVDLTSSMDKLREALKPNTKLVWFETPSNPLLKVVDIEAVVRTVKAHNSECLVVVDNTFMTPYFQLPLQFGADAVMHSLTKYINGHTDVLMGAVVTNQEHLDKHLAHQQKTCGSVPSSFDAYLVLRGLKTLHLRMRQHAENGLVVARWLERDPRVDRVLYPALESHPQHALHKRQCSGMSGMISFCLRSTVREDSETFLTSLKIVNLATSCGGFESLAILLTAAQSHALVPPEVRGQLGIGDNLIRLSVGCEDVEDLLHDLDQALQAATGRVREV